MSFYYPVGEGNSRIYGVEIKKGGGPYIVNSYILYIAAEEKWFQRTTEVFFPRDYWRNPVSTTGVGDGTGGGSSTTGDGGKNSAVVCMSSELLNDWSDLY